VGFVGFGAEAFVFVFFVGLEVAFVEDDLRVAFEGDSQVVFFEGNFQAYEEDKHKRLGTEADKPHRIKYRKLTMG